MITARSPRLASLVIVVSVLAACTNASREPDPAPSTEAAGVTPAATPSSSVAGLDATPHFAAVLLAATRDPLDPSILPPGYHFKDAVEIDDGTAAVSNIYGGPDGPTGPTIWLHTQIARDYATDRQADLTWSVESGFPDGYTVRSAEGGDDHVFVDIDAHGAVDASIQLVGRDVPIADLRAMALRILSTTDR